MSLVKKLHDVPMLFKALVRGVLNDLKWVTRRQVKGAAAKWLIDQPPDWVASKANVLCPYGQPGDRLWVREAWATHASLNNVPPRALVHQSVVYLADRQPREGKYRPAIYMPRWASRIVLEVFAVRVERLQGFPDDYTLIPWRGRPDEECPDGPRYKALGNSKAVPVVRWIGQRILQQLRPTKP